MNLEEQVNQDMDAILSTCDSTATPLICRKMMTEAGRNYIKSRMVHLVLNENVTPIKSALAHIEQELNGM